MLRFFYVLLTFSVLIAMEKDQESPTIDPPSSFQESTSPTIDPPISSEEPTDVIFSRAQRYKEEGEKMYKKAKKEKPKVYAGSTYEQAEIYFSEAYKLFVKAHEKNYPGARVCAYYLYEERLVKLQKIKAALKRNYSLSENWQKVVQEEKNLPHPDNKEFITWQQALTELKNKKMPKDKKFSEETK